MWQFSSKSEKKIFDPFFKTFWLIEAKMMMKMKKYEKMSPLFEFFISKLGYVAIFMKILKKFLTHLLRHF